VRGLKAWPTTEGSVVALALDKAQGLRGFAFARAELSASESAAPAESLAGDEQEPTTPRSPTAGKPYVYLATPGGALERLTAGAQLSVTGRGFAPRSTVEVLVDGAAAEKAAVREDGTFGLTLTAPQGLGVHTLTVRDADTQRVIDGAQFKVNRGLSRGADNQRPAVGRALYGNHEEDERAGQPVRITPPKRRR
jgi:hypothetical protein